MDHRKAPGGQVQELTGAMQVRPARSGEAAALSALASRSKAHWGYDARFMASCAGELTWAEADLAVDRVWVVEDDAGRALWRKARDVATATGVAAAGLDADPHAVGFYERMGARVVGEVPSGSIPGRSCRVWNCRC